MNIKDITEFVKEQYTVLQAKGTKAIVSPKERVYVPSRDKTCQDIGLDFVPQQTVVSFTSWGWFNQEWYLFKVVIAIILLLYHSIFVIYIYVYLNDKEYLANIIFVKTQSFGPQWRPQRLTMNCCYGKAGIVSCAGNVQKILFFLFKDGADLRMENFSCKAKFAHFITWCEWLHLFEDLLFDVEVDIFVF